MHAVASGAFDDIRSPDIRFLQEAARLARLTVLVWDDESVSRLTGRVPKFPLSERLYFLNALCYVSQVQPISPHSADSLPDGNLQGVHIWADMGKTINEQRQRFCHQRGIHYHFITGAELAGFPEPVSAPPGGGKKVIVTGCYDWLHSGHLRFFEEVGAQGDLYVIVGNDANIRLLKGAGHPLMSQEERRYIVGSIRYVTAALIATGQGWLDAEPEIRRLKPDIYAVNEDGDRGGKREYCLSQGIEYLVLKRTPAPGLPKRSSTDLRGF